MNIPRNRLPTGNPSLHIGGPPVRGGSKVLKGTLIAIGVGIGAVGIVASFVPGVGAALNIPLMGLSHVVDRFKNGTDANDELKYRAEYYSTQIFKQLNITPDKPRKATVAEFKKAAAVNPALAKLYQAPIRKKNKENSTSLLTNGGIAAASFIPGTVAVAEAGKLAVDATRVAKVVAGTVQAAKSLLPAVAGGLAGGALAQAINKDHVDPQELIEAMHKTIASAKEKGIDPSQVIEPNLIFLLRVSQDPQLAENIKQTFGHGKKSFQQMNDDEQTQVMLAYPALANAATSEAYAVSHDMFQVQELGASKPNLNGMANQYAVGARNSSFVNRLNTQRSAAIQNQNAGITA